jgi:hypothetical protein
MVSRSIRQRLQMDPMMLLLIHKRQPIRPQHEKLLNCQLRNFLSLMLLLERPVLLPIAMQIQNQLKMNQYRWQHYHLMFGLLRRPSAQRQTPIVIQLQLFLTKELVNLLFSL